MNNDNKVETAMAGLNHVGLATLLQRSKSGRHI